MATDNMTTWDSLLKEHYDGQSVKNLSYQNRPFLALLQKKENIVGKMHPLPVIYGDVENRSATIASALAGTTGVVNEQFAMTMVKNYGAAFIDRQLLLSANGDAGSFADAAIKPIDSMINGMSNDLSFSLFRGVSGARGQVLAEPAEAGTTVITLKSVKDISGFNLGQVITIYSAESGGSQRIYATAVLVGSISAIDRNAGTVTIAAAYDSNGTIAANDYIFVSGDRGLKCAGLEAWLPITAPSSAVFFGVDRTADVVRLAGNRTVGTGMPIEEALLQAAFDVSDVGGGTPDTIIMNHKQMAKLVKSLGSKVQYVDVAVGAVGFRALEIHGAAGPLKVIADRHCPDARAYVLQMDTFKLLSTGPVIQMVDEDVKMLRQGASDGYEVRGASYYNLGCEAPGFNGVVTLDA